MIFLSKTILIVSNSIDIVADTPNRITVLVFTVGCLTASGHVLFSQLEVGVVQRECSG